ncbi:MAG: hypothetical protein BMS9Abin37_0571 [Acidobacteriota bacterium]|nr:MAG: hypothetical protein BMS9Abin37_0571 [Acidobacteriota bacterium]
MTQDLQLINPANAKPLCRRADCLVDEDGQQFPLSRGVYRFVEGDDYAESFGLQWNRFERTQIDRYRNGYRQSRDRFFAATEWDARGLSGQRILEVGSGAGRFTQVVLDETAAELYSVDVSSAVDANFRNNGHNERLHLFQASIYELPFAPGQFDKVFCFGVLQHTPDVRKSVECLVEMVRPGGELVVDFYPIKGWYTKLHVKYLLRPITRRMDNTALLRLIEKHADHLIAAYRVVHRFRIGRVAKRLIPVCDIDGTLPPDLDESSLREWVILDTFDMFSPRYDQPQRISTVARWFRAFGMKSVWSGLVTYGENNSVAIVRGLRPSAVVDEG